MNAFVITQWVSSAVLVALILGTTRRGRQFVVWIDQGLNLIIGSGWADETPSCYFRRVGGWRERATNLLFFWQKDATGKRNHCERALASERARRHLPPELRV